jgi:hypothetical protein
LPSGAKTVADVLTLHLKSGEYKFGTAAKVVTFRGVDYSLLVTGPR